MYYVVDAKALNETLKKLTLARFYVTSRNLDFPNLNDPPCSKNFGKYHFTPIVMAVRVKYYQNILQINLQA